MLKYLLCDEQGPIRQVILDADSFVLFVINDLFSVSER